MIVSLVIGYTVSLLSQSSYIWNRDVLHFPLQYFIVILSVLVAGKLTTGKIYGQEIELASRAGESVKMADVNLSENEYVRFANGKGTNFVLLIETWPY